MPPVLDVARQTPSRLVGWMPPLASRSRALAMVAGEQVVSVPVVFMYQLYNGAPSLSKRIQICACYAASMSSKREHIAISDARANLTELVAVARLQGKTFILTQRGTPRAAVVPLELLDRPAPKRPPRDWCVALAAFASDLTGKPADELTFEDLERCRAEHGLPTLDPRGRSHPAATAPLKGRPAVCMVMVLGPEDTVDAAALREAVTAAFAAQGIAGEFSEAWVQDFHPDLPPGPDGSCMLWVTGRDADVWRARYAELGGKPGALT